MINHKFDELLSRLGAKSPLPDKSLIKDLFKSSLQQLDLVTREEFDAQKAVLARTQEKLASLELQLKDLQSQIDNQSHQ